MMVRTLYNKKSFFATAIATVGVKIKCIIRQEPNQVSLWLSINLIKSMLHNIQTTPSMKIVMEDNI